MLNGSDFGKRIQKIMNYYAISAASFADYMGVGRSSISHILSGRNKPSLDFVMKIVEAYKEVDLQWLLYGTGVFPKSEDLPKKETPIVSSPSPVIPSPVSIASTIEQDLFTNAAPKEIRAESSQPPLPETIKSISMSETAIDRIVIFYVDGTFNSYQMKKT